MFFDILTLFPAMFKSPLEHSIIGRAIKKQLVEVNLIDIRDFTRDKHQVTDDYSYGGGAGMVMKIEPIYRAVEMVRDKRPADTPVILLSPQGERLNQDLVKKYNNYPGLIMICGRYEGVDERVRDRVVDHEVSIGDYVLTGGEIPAMVMIDALTRMQPSALGDEQSKIEDSFYKGLLDYPHYTRPRSYKGMDVPDILLSGDHARIKKWRSKQALKRTLLRRPDLLSKKELTGKQQKLLEEVKDELEGED